MKNGISIKFFEYIVLQNKINDHKIIEKTLGWTSLQPSSFQIHSTFITVYQQLSV